MIEFVPDIVQILFPLAIGLVAIFLYTKSRKLGSALIGVAFFVGIVPSCVNLALGGPYLPLRLRDQGYTMHKIGAFYYYLFLLRGTFYIVFSILVITGLIKLSADISK